MNTKFKRHQRVRLLSKPRAEDIEPYQPNVKINSGIEGTINILLPNGRYHVKISDKKGDEVAYVAMDEEQLESLD